MLIILLGVFFSKLGSVGLLMFGVEFVLMICDGEEIGDDDGGLFVIKWFWFFMFCMVYGDDECYCKSYWGEILYVYFVGDGVCCDYDGYYMIVGWVDDVFNVFGY